MLISNLHFNWAHLLSVKQFLTVDHTWWVCHTFKDFGFTYFSNDFSAFADTSDAITKAASRRCFILSTNPMWLLVVSVSWGIPRKATRAKRGWRPNMRKTVKTLCCQWPLHNMHGSWSRHSTSSLFSDSLQEFPTSSVVIFWTSQPCHFPLGDMTLYGFS